MQEGKDPKKISNEEILINVRLQTISFSLTLSTIRERKTFCMIYQMRTYGNFRCYWQVSVTKGHVQLNIAWKTFFYFIWYLVKKNLWKLTMFHSTMLSTTISKMCCWTMQTGRSPIIKKFVLSLINIYLKDCKFKYFFEKGECNMIFNIALDYRFFDESNTWNWTPSELESTQSDWSEFFFHC